MPGDPKKIEIMKLKLSKEQMVAIKEELGLELEALELELVTETVKVLRIRTPGSDLRATLSSVVVAN